MNSSDFGMKGASPTQGEGEGFGKRGHAEQTCGSSAGQKEIHWN